VRTVWVVTVVFAKHLWTGIIYRHHGTILLYSLVEAVLSRFDHLFTSSAHSWEVGLGPYSTGSNLKERFRASLGDLSEMMCETGRSARMNRS